MTSLCIGLIKDKYQRMTTMISDHWSPLQQDSGQHENGARLQRLPLCSPITLGSRESNKAGWGKDLLHQTQLKRSSWWRKITLISSSSSSEQPTIPSLAFSLHLRFSCTRLVSEAISEIPPSIPAIPWHHWYLRHVADRLDGEQAGEVLHPPQAQVQQGGQGHRHHICL